MVPGMLYEPRHAPPISTRQFLVRLARHGGVVVILMAVSLGVGMLGYEYFERLAWRDAFLNASMLLSGMGPVDPPQTANGKLFAGFYALYAGIVFIASAGVLAVPVVHRILHYFHFDDRQP